MDYDRTAQEYVERQYATGLATRAQVRKVLARSADKRIESLERQVRALQQSVNYMASLLLDEPIEGGEPVRVLVDAEPTYEAGG